MQPLSHLDPLGRARMVDISEKADTNREARARGAVHLQPKTLRMILDKSIPKGDVLAVARVAGIMAAKGVDRLIPLCHPLAITSAEVTFSPHPEQGTIEIESRVKVNGKTGAEMEALTAVSVAALTIYDMCKAVDRGITIENIRLISKRGGKSGNYRRPGEKD
ncbi:MAG: cyclic pyranopterin monophosphate synthase MoaC [Candidatus Methylomirabilales bacterium]|nr:cyclic pyranopterin monophosphate synthase MoaC [candidate division NC10 bacterium]MCH7896655.1 cyclic pyranopterin monophosphate synthase MoaC [candidate division NC10 bacterium]MCZ6551640.1 cyclic pyranopterin monophosphate synthase MoaC [candidate division NC10 bacterium]